jgi:hypothetical protein
MDYQMLDEQGRTVVEIAAIAGANRILICFMKRVFVSPDKSNTFVIPSMTIPRDILIKCKLTNRLIRAIDLSKIDVTVIDKKNRTILMRAIHLRLSINNINKIIDGGVDINHRDLNRTSALDIAIESYPDVLPILLQKGARVIGDRFSSFFANNPTYQYGPIVLRELIRRRNYGLTYFDISAIIQTYLLSSESLNYVISDIMKMLCNMPISYQEIGKLYAWLEKDERIIPGTFILLQELVNFHNTNCPKVKILFDPVKWCTKIDQKIKILDQELVKRVINQKNIGIWCENEHLMNVITILALNLPEYAYANSIAITHRDYRFLPLEKYKILKTILMLRQIPDTVLSPIPNELISEIFQYVAHV